MHQWKKMGSNLCQYIRVLTSDSSHTIQYTANPITQTFVNKDHLEICLEEKYIKKEAEHGREKTFFA